MATADMPKLEGMTAETKRSLLRALVMDLAPTTGSLGSIDVGDRHVYVYAPPPHARAIAEESMRNATPEETADLHRRADNIGRTLSLEEVISRLDEPDEG